jgi:serine/threonine protein kinase/Tol biopolymer transport system component
MGVVYRASDIKLDRVVALKFLPPHLSSDPILKKRFILEAKAASALDHPNICTVHEIDETEDGQLFIAMSCYDGQTLKATIDHRPLPIPDAVSIAIQTAQGLSKAHSQGIFHRDIKPANLMITRDGVVKIVDFGLAKHAGATAITEPGTQMGTLAYMSPEQVRGDEVDHRSDVWSLGVVLYECLTGRLPFKGNTPQTVLLAILNDPIVPLNEVNAGLPRDLQNVVAKALAKPLSGRYASVDEMRADLRQFARDMQFDLGLSDSTEIITRTLPHAQGPNRRMDWRWKAALAAIAIILAIATALAWKAAGTHARPEMVLSRVTTDPGLNYHPAISPDGRLIAFASDRGNEGNLDIWLAQTEGHQAVRLTDDPADDDEPAFSPEGDRVVFRSQRDGGGIYTVSALGGDARLIAKRGRNPRYSPDGKYIAYWTGDENMVPCQLWIAPVQGGEPRSISPEFFIARYPVWAPDSGHVLFQGIHDGNVSRQAVSDWWVADITGGPAIATGAYDLFKPLGLLATDTVNRPLPGAWLTSGDRIVFSARLGDSSNLWEVPVSSSSWKVSGPPTRLTTGTSQETGPSAAREGSLAFASLRTQTNVFQLHLNAEEGRIRGDLEPLTLRTGHDSRPFLSVDGTRAVYISDRTGNSDIWSKDLSTGKETNLTFSPDSENYGIISADGKKIAYMKANTKRSIYSVDFAGGSTEKVCDICGTPAHWSPDGKYILYEIEGEKARVPLSAVEVSSGRKFTVVSDPKLSLFDPRFSPDGHWISFHASVRPGMRRIFVIPFRDGKVPEKVEWIPITGETTSSAFSWWSPQGHLLYYVSDRDGFRCIWAQKLDPATRRPIGDPLAVYHLHRTRLSLSGLPPTLLKVSIGGGKLVLSLRELSGDIWKARF